jgi:hypothetical protein
MGFRFNPFIGNFDIDTKGTSAAANLSGTIATTVTSDVDSILLTDLKTVRYDIVIWTTTKSRRMNMIVTNDSSGLSDSVFAKVGSSVSANVNAVVSGLDMKLRIENNELVTLNYEINRSKIP